MYQIWKENVNLPKISELKKLKAEIVTIKPFEPEKDGYVFLHGVALAMFKGRLYCAWAHNKDQENSDKEEVNFAVSDDSGKTWSGCIKGNMRPNNGAAVSHGAFLIHEDSLYFFAPHFKGQLCSELLNMAVYVLDERNGFFRYLGIAMDERFWPMCEPVRMNDGNYIMSGIYVASGYKDPDNSAAVAISHGSDVLHWDMVKLDRSEDVLVWGECSVTVRKNKCRLYCRQHPGPLKALYAESLDYGKTWTTLDSSDLPMIDSKPYCGTLSTGQDYLICSSAADIHGRDPLTIALTEPGKDAFSKIFAIDEGSVLSYPYAIELNRMLYVAYSSAEGYTNRNAAKLAIIDLKEFD